MRIIIFLSFFFSGLFAMDTGSIAGKIIDRETGETLPGANVLVLDTKLGASSDNSGFFEIKNVPVGSYTIQAIYIGYNAVKLTGVEVIADSTFYLVIKMSSSAMEMAEAIVVTAERAKISKDMTSSKSTYSDKIIITKPVEPKISKRKAVPLKSGLKAGFTDDNKQYNYFINFLEKYKNRVNHYPNNVSERIHIKVLDDNGKSVPNAHIQVYAGPKILSEGKSYADGSYLFFPSNYSQDFQSYKLKYSYNQPHNEVEIPRFGERNVELKIGLQRQAYNEVPLDILFILDTTGSMGEEIKRLIATIDIIHLNLNSISSKPKIRFGLVLYRDKNDDYVTKVIPLTDDLEYFREELNKVSANGGGDGPEDLQSALEKAMHAIDWNDNGLRLGFIITDAPPHLDYGQEYTYIDAANEAKECGIKLFSVGTGGLNISGEYVLRQISQFTYSKYIFLTYGEKGESEGGRPGSVSHHTGSNYQTDKLEAIIIRIAKEELDHLTDKPFGIDGDYFQATKIADETKEQTLNKLFTEAISKLSDYSSYKIENNTPLGVLPISSKDSSFHLDSEYFTEQLIFSLSENKTFKLTERADLQKIMEELGLQLYGFVDESNTSKVGKLIGAEMLLSGNLYSKNKDYEIFIKLLRVETGEILAITKIKIDRQLGLNN